MQVTSSSVLDQAIKSLHDKPRPFLQIHKEEADQLRMAVLAQDRFSQMQKARMVFVIALYTQEAGDLLDCIANVASAVAERSCLSGPPLL